MSTSDFHLRFERIDPARNMARFYHITIEPSLFGEIAVIRNWGRIGTHGRSKAAYFDNEKTAIEAFLALASVRRKRGYRPNARD